MTQSRPVPANPRLSSTGNFFGIPLGDMGWFASLLMAVASGFMAFFASTFCAILSILIYNITTHHAVDFGLSYRRVGFPIGVVVMAVALGYMASLWFKRITRK